MWLEALVIAILFVYTALILVSVCVLFFSKEKDGLYNFIPTEKISVLIPFRNEAQNILICLNGIVTQDYPKELIELILIDDHSDDDSKQLASVFLSDKNISYKIIELKKHHLIGKKAAIELAVSQVWGNIIITRDADTFTKSNLWLKNIVHLFKNKGTDLVLAPVILTGSSFIQVFQQFENMAITTIGYAFAKSKVPFVCSGANLAYRKDRFIQADPYKYNKHIASGDDMFLLQSFIDKHFSVSTTRNIHAIVYTNAQETIFSFINQRLRWASKAKNLRIKSAQAIGSILFLSNLILLIVGVSAFFGGINYKFCLFALIYKCIIEFLLLFLGRFMYKQKLNVAYFLPAFIANLFYIPMISMASILVKSNWKGRKEGV